MKGGGVRLGAVRERKEEQVIKQADLLLGGQCIPLSFLNLNLYKLLKKKRLPSTFPASKLVKPDCPNKTFCWKHM